MRTGGSHSEFGCNSRVQNSFYTVMLHIKSKVMKSRIQWCKNLAPGTCLGITRGQNVGFWVLFSSPEQSPGRAIALPPASASASTFTLKFFKSLYFPDHLIDMVHIWYDDRYSSKVLFSNTLPKPMTSRSRSQT